MNARQQLEFVVRKLALSDDCRDSYDAGQGCVDPKDFATNEDYEAAAHRAGVERVFCFLVDRSFIVTEAECDDLISDLHR